MIEFYPQIKWIHLVAVIASGGLFLLRGLAVQAQACWPMAAPVRWLSYGIDSVLLAAAVALVAVLPAALYANGWLTVKLVLLVLYIGLGTVALKRGRTQGQRQVAFVAALVVYGSIIAVARAHHPLGPLVALLN